jgi:hypothetical protein
MAKQDKQPCPPRRRNCPVDSSCANDSLLQGRKEDNSSRPESELDAYNEIEPEFIVELGKPISRRKNTTQSSPLDDLLKPERDRPQKTKSSPNLSASINRGRSSSCDRPRSSSKIRRKSLVQSAYSRQSKSCSNLSLPMPTIHEFRPNAQFNEMDDSLDARSDHDIFCASSSSRRRMDSTKQRGETLPRKGKKSMALSLLRDTSLPASIQTSCAFSIGLSRSEGKTIEKESKQECVHPSCDRFQMAFCSPTRLMSKKVSEDLKKNLPSIPSRFQSPIKTPSKRRAKVRMVVM